MMFNFPYISTKCEWEWGHEEWNDYNVSNSNVFFMLNLVVIYSELCCYDGINIAFHPAVPYQTTIVDRTVLLVSYLTICLSIRGLLARSVLQAQAASPIFTHVYAAVVAIINSKFPQIGELILKRLILTFRKSYRRNLKVPLACLQL